MLIILFHFVAILYFKNVRVLRQSSAHVGPKAQIMSFCVIVLLLLMLSLASLFTLSLIFFAVLHKIISFP